MVKGRIEVGAALILATCAAFAQPALDGDGDGLISSQEFQQQAAERFARLDTDSDGYLTVEELRQGRAGMRRRPRGGPGRMFDRADSDQDGALSLSEIQTLWPNMTPERFSEVDQNGDGLITPDERPRPRF